MYRHIKMSVLEWWEVEGYLLASSSFDPMYRYVEMSARLYGSIPGHL